MRRTYRPSLPGTILLGLGLWVLTCSVIAWLILTDTALPYPPARAASAVLAVGGLLMMLAFALSAAYRAGDAIGGPAMELAARGVDARERLIFALFRVAMRMRLAITLVVGAAPLIALGPVTAYQYQRLLSSLMSPPELPALMLALPLALTGLVICLLMLALICGVWAGLRWGATPRARIMGPLVTAAWAALPLILIYLIQPYTRVVYPWHMSLRVVRALLAVALSLLPALFGLWMLRLTVHMLDGPVDPFVNPGIE